MNKEISPRNAKGQPHGYWERYWDGELRYKCVFINGKRNGVDEHYWSDGKLTHKRYCL